MQPRRSERLRLKREQEERNRALRGSSPQTERRRSERLRSQRRRTQIHRTRRRISATRIDLSVGPYRYLLRPGPDSDGDNNFLNFHNYNDDNEENTLRMALYFIRVALYESPSLARIFRRNPERGIRKFIEIINYLFF